MAISLKALDDLIKLHKRNADLHKIKLAALVQDLVKLQNELVESDKNVKREKEFLLALGDAALALMAVTLEQFLKQQLSKQQTLITQMMKLHEEITALQENIVTENQTIKKYEIIKEKEVKLQVQKQKSQEEKALEEIILNQVNKNLY
jgi:hypothetical protein